MSRNIVILVIAGYAVTAVAFGVFVEMQKPFATLAGLASAYELGAILGIALPAFVIPGIFALIVWAFMRFRAENATGPLITWLTLLVVYCAFMGYGAIYGKQKRAAAEALKGVEQKQQHLSVLEAVRVETTSNFALVRLPRGIELAVPKGWWLIESNYNRLIDTSVEAVMDAHRDLPSHVTIAGTTVP